MCCTTDPPSRRCEDEADEFAGEFLMPANDIRHQFSSRTDLNDLAQLKLHWRVSMQALLSRALVVGRITKAHNTRLWKLISMHGYRRCEPNGFRLEQAGLLAEMVRVHTEKLEFSLDDLCDLLGIEAEEVRLLYRPYTASEDPVAKQVPHLRLVE
ncbi:MAG: ImmA/IrrE family metallo-endopeptidase [Myxococcales bacterium]|nr:ImmA/IrrE family metallo-endopeptidase [Myxococcales bacterium]